MPPRVEVGSQRRPMTHTAGHWNWIHSFALLLLRLAMRCPTNWLSGQLYPSYRSRGWCWCPRNSSRLNLKFATPQVAESCTQQQKVNQSIAHHRVFFRTCVTPVCDGGSVTAHHKSAISIWQSFCRCEFEITYNDHARICNMSKLGGKLDGRDKIKTIFHQKRKKLRNKYFYFEI